MSASMSPTRWPARASATARFAETVDLPTPPLPDEMASTVPRWWSSTGVGGGGTPPGPVRGAGWRGAGGVAPGGRGRGRYPSGPGRGGGLAGSGPPRRTARVGAVAPPARHALHGRARLPPPARERAGITAAEKERERDHPTPRHDE